MGAIMSRRVFVDRFRPLCRLISLGVAGALTGSVVAAVSAPAVAAGATWPVSRPERVIPHTDLVLSHPPDAAAARDAPDALEARSWPAAGEADVTLPRAVAPENSRRADLGAPVAGPTPAGTLPVLL